MKRLCLMLCALCVSQAIIATPLKEVVGKVKPSIVGVGFYAPLATVSHQLKGTGFVVGDGHYVVTNNHVITAVPKSEDNIKYNRVIFVPKGKKYTINRVKQVYTDEMHDIAILEIDKPLPALKLVAKDKQVADGEDIALTGFPIGAALGLYPATHKGIVAAYSPNIISAANSQQLSELFLASLKHPFMVYQLDITAYPGNSGSPVYLADTGEVFSVVNKVFVKETKESAITAPSGITYAIPVEHIYALAEKHGLF
ncbi:serine protease [Alteromonas sp. C1M14]|uniref:S1 family peptidase n=1 Tax=Alteromonas sp. C1M14 TaxID=2841567 RepID=UPI001C090AA6|nr:serine protease [Alteromonas sp. C1M14]MBU2979193.1 serine protease [Alteromonas sp. C1M14]